MESMKKLLLHDYSGQKCINIGIKLKVMLQINFILNSQRIAGSKQTIDQEIVCHFPGNNRRTTRIPDFRVKIQQIQFFFYVLKKTTFGYNHEISY